MALSRLYTFTAGQTILASEVNAEFNQLINFLNGTVLADATMKNSSAGTPTLIVDHTGGGKPFSARVGGNAAVEVNNLRQLLLTPVAGNAPIVIAAGFPKVENLDVDKVDGYEGGDFARKNANFCAETSSAYSWLGMKRTGSPGGVYIGSNSVGHYEVGYAEFGSGPGITGGDNFPGFVGTISGSNPDDHVILSMGRLRADLGDPVHANEYTRKAYVDAKTSDWAFGAYYDGVIATATVQPFYISPSAKITLLKLRAVYKSGTPTGASTVKLGRYNSTGTLIQEWTITIPQAQAAGSVVTANVATNNVLAENDTLRWTVTAAGAHADVTVYVTGTEGLL